MTTHKWKNVSGSHTVALEEIPEELAPFVDPETVHELVLEYRVSGHHADAYITSDPYYSTPPESDNSAEMEACYVLDIDGNLVPIPMSVQLELFERYREDIEEKSVDYD